MSTSALLAERAADYHKQIMDAAMGPGGMIVSFVPFDTRKPYQEGEDCPWQQTTDVWNPYLPHPTFAEGRYGENTLWATGMFLYSQMLRYRASGEPDALATARKCFRDLNHIFRLCWAIEPGLLGKPHGGRAGATTSFDQSAIPVLPYVQFAQELATAEERAEAERTMRAHGEYYLRRNWVVNHFNNLERIVPPRHTSVMKYLACVHAAYDLTGETAFRDAALLYMRQLIAGGKLPWPSNPYETNHNLLYYAYLCDYWSKTDIADEADWRTCIAAYWRAAQTALDGEGLPLFGHYDAAQHTFTPYPEGWLPRAGMAAYPGQASQRLDRQWISPTCLPNRPLVSACVAALGLFVRGWGLDDNAHQVAERILLRLDEDTVRWWWWDEGQLPDELKPALNIFAPEVAAVWLIAYWMGRLQQVW